MVCCSTMSGSLVVALAGVVAFTAAGSTSGWPASAGVQPKVAPTKFKDPRARYFDPPAGRYRLPDGTIREADPPRGFYDPPPGHYAVPPPGLDQRLPRAVIGPLPTAEGSVDGWIAKRRRLRIGLGISLGTMGAGLLVLAIPSAPSLDGYPPGIFATMVFVPVGLIAAIATGISLRVHARRRPMSSRVQVLADGLRLSF
jgi:hypothetical protein